MDLPTLEKLVATALVVVLIVLLVRHLNGDLRILLQQLQHELMRISFYTPQTIRSKDARFTRHRAPSRLPTTLLLVAIAIGAAVVWWLTR